jgi:threonine aldolase
MLQAMINATIGDDVFDEDPTVKELENYAANLFGKEAGLYCPSGTMTSYLSRTFSRIFIRGWRHGFQFGSECPTGKW